MKSKSAMLFMSLPAVSVQTDTAVSNIHVSYIIGGVVAFLILGYLIYTLLHPEKF